MSDFCRLRQEAAPRRGARARALMAGLLLVSAAATPAIAEKAGEKPGKWQLRASGEALAAPDKPSGPAVTAIQASKNGARTQIVVTLNEPVDAAPFLLANPDRAVLDLPDVAFQSGAAAANQTLSARKGQFAISAYRFGQLEAGKSRIVFDLTGPAKLAAARLETVDGVHRYVMEFEQVERSEFMAAVQTEAARPAAAPAPPATADSGDKRPVIVLDPGHGGIDAGARGAAQMWEKEVVLAFAQALAEKLEATGRYRIVFTRSGDTFVALPDRVKIAQQAGAKLFISIHADTLNQGWVQGATVYTVSDKASDAHAARLAEKENESDKLAGVEAKEDKGEVSDILFDLTRKETRTFSHFFARSLVGYWKEAGKLNKNPLRAAGFRVLMAHDVPSVLLELGYLSSPTEAAKLAQPEWRAKAASAVAKSVDAFFSPRADAGEAAGR